MRKLLLWVLFFLIPFLYSVYVCAQQKKVADCSTTCFSSEVVSVAKISDACTSYELKVSFSGNCGHALSHYTVGVPCGKIENVWNSQNWAQEIGTDPTTGLTGFKIDNTAGFGESAITSFTVKFAVCATTECSAQLNCWQPQVAYKASTCVNYETVAITCNSLKASLQKTDASCFGLEDGSLTVVTEGGKEPYSYVWSDNASGAARTGLMAGNYSVAVRDAAGEQIMLEETISQPEEIVLSGIPVPATCNGMADGSIDLTVTGVNGDYTVAWSNGQQTEDIQGLGAGQYTVTITDERNCSASSTLSVGVRSKIDVTAVQSRPDCNAANGSIDISVAGGSGSYIFDWSNGATTEDLVDVEAGLYTLAVTDYTGCSATASYFLRDVVTLAVKGEVTSTGCADGDDSGAIDLIVSGGAPGYTFAWSTGETSEDLAGLASGNYAVTVTDSKNCSVTATFSVTMKTFQVPRTIVQPSCHDDTNGSITLQDPIGGTGPFTYLWSNGETGTALTDLDAGTYSVTVKDATGCSKTLTCTIANPAEIFADATVSNVDCNAGSFSIDLTVSGGTAPYTYQWSSGDSSEDIEVPQGGTYSVVITDAHGCSVSKEVAVTPDAAPWSCIINELSSMPQCGSANNTLSTPVTDADSYLWTVESTDGNWSILTADSPSIIFTAGAANSSAAFSLTIVKDGCTRTCSYSVSACTDQDGGETDPGEQPGGEDPEGGNETCEECFNTVARIVEQSGACRTYEMEVSSNGRCRHDLSHWTVAIPCGTISNYWNSAGWKMELGKDPTTGLTGLKVDGISDFGKEAQSFTVRFTVCEAGDCELSAWQPDVAYKAGLCASMQTIQIHETATSIGVLSVYPNPFNEVIRFEWSAANEEVDLQIIDQYGNLLSRHSTPTGRSDAYYINLESSALPSGLYYYRLTADGRTFNGKISKR